MRCLPTGSCFSIPCKGVEGSLSGRISKNWRTIPAVAVTAILVIALTASLIYGPPGLSVTYGVGVGLSTYLLYLAYQYRHLQSLEHSATAFEEALKRLDGILGGFDESKAGLDNSLTTLTTQVTSLGEDWKTKLDVVTGIADKLSTVLSNVNIEERNKALGRLEGLETATKERVTELQGLAGSFKTQLDQLMLATGKVNELHGITEQLAAFETRVTTAVNAMVVEQTKDDPIP